MPDVKKHHITLKFKKAFKMQLLLGFIFRSVSFLQPNFHHYQFPENSSKLSTKGLINFKRRKEAVNTPLRLTRQTEDRSAPAPLAFASPGPLSPPWLPGLRLRRGPSPWSERHLRRGPGAGAQAGPRGLSSPCTTPDYPKPQGKWRKIHCLLFQKEPFVFGHVLFLSFQLGFIAQLTLG